MVRKSFPLPPVSTQQEEAMTMTQHAELEKSLCEWFILFAQKSKETSKMAGQARFYPIILNYKHSLRNEFIKEMKPVDTTFSEDYFLEVAQKMVELAQTQFGEEEPTINQIASLSALG